MPYPNHLFSTLSLVSAPLSLFGSSAMIYVLSKSRDKLKTTLNRLLFCLCIGDIILSFAFLFYKAVAEEEDKLGPDGEPMYSIPVATNQAACNAQGFFFVLGSILSPFYNCALCVYYLCVIKFNYSDTKIKKKIEPYLHAVPWTWASFCAVYALASKSINANRLTCWIEPAPFDCQYPEFGVDCKRGKNAVKLRTILATGPLIAIFFAICGIMAVVYLTVLKQERRMRRYDDRAQARSLAGRRNEPNMIAGRQIANSVRGRIRENASNSRTVLNQALAYVGAYLFSYILVFINQFIVIKSGKYNLTILVLSSVLYPLQGFFNFLVFIYPRISRQLRGNDDMNVLQALLAAVQCRPIPQRRNRNRNVGGSPAGEGGGSNNILRNISGVNGTPSTYNGSHSTAGQPPTTADVASALVVSNISSNGLDTGPTVGQPLTTASTDVASALVVSNISSNGLDTGPTAGQPPTTASTDVASALVVSNISYNGLDTGPKKKISFAGECIADDSTTCTSRSHPPESILRNSLLTSSPSVEDGVGILPGRKLAVVGSTPPVLIPRNYTEALDERGETEGKKDVDYLPEKPDDLEWEQGARSDDDEDEEIGSFMSLHNIRRLSYAASTSIIDASAVLELISENDDNIEE